MATEALETIDDEVSRGQPTAYQPEYAEQARKLCLLAAVTDEELAEFFDVSVRTIYRWKHAQPDFCQALKDGKTIADRDVAVRLHEKAMGYEYDEAVPSTVRKVKYEDGKRVSEETEVVVTNVRRRQAPDTTAAIFWLKNRRSDAWRDRSDVDVTSNGQTISSLAAAAWAYGEQLRAQQISSIEGPDAQKLLSEPREP